MILYRYGYISLADETVVIYLNANYKLPSFQKVDR